jgi:hypothetical protein
MAKDKTGTANDFIDEYGLFLCWVDSKLIGFVDQHRFSPPLSIPLLYQFWKLKYGKNKHLFLFSKN